MAREVHTMVDTAVGSSFSRPAPNSWDTTMEDPMESPMSSALTKWKTGEATPTPARDPDPTERPKIIVSTRL